MSFRSKALNAVLFVSSFAVSAGAQNTASAPRHITLPEAVQLALKQNHVVRIAGLKVDEKQDAKDVARSAYLPSIRNESRILRVTDTQFIEIARGSLGTVAGTPVPETSDVISQGGRTFVTSGTGLVQPLSQLFTRIKPENEAAQADLNASRADAQETQNEVALKVHQIYYQLLIAQLRRQRSRGQNPGRSGPRKRTYSAGEVRQRAGSTIDRESGPTTPSQARLADNGVADFRPDHATR